MPSTINLLQSDWGTIKQIARILTPDQFPLQVTLRFPKVQACIVTVDSAEDAARLPGVVKGILENWTGVVDYEDEGVRIVAVESRGREVARESDVRVERAGEGEGGANAY